MVLSGTHDSTLVALSIIVAVLTSFTALSLSSRVRASRGSMRRLWLIAATIALGGGIWSMHFVAMLAFRMPGMEMSYDLALTVVSLAMALVFTGLGFAVMNWEVVSAWRIFPAGLLMGSGVLAMHYIGMAAMQMPATVRYDRPWVVISILIAIGAATAAIWLAAREQKLAHRLTAGVVMGLAIAGMHYAGMRAAIFTATDHADMAHGVASFGQAFLATLISGVTLLILAITLGAARVERLLQGFARREARIALRLKVADVLRARDTDEALSEVAALIGKHFSVARTGYGQLDPVEDLFDYDVCWTDGSVPPLLGRLPAAAFGVKIVAALGAGTTVAIDDLLASDLSDEPRTRETAREVDTRSILVVPFVRDGRLRTIVYLNDRQPRQWHREDIAFMEEIAERTRLVIERAAVEERLRHLNATLEARIDARTQELREAQSALLQSQKMEAIGQLVAGLAHDFNNVLGAMVGAFDMAHRRADDADRVRRFAEAGLKAGERGAKLTAQLLSFSRSQHLELRPMYVCDVIQAGRDLLDRTLGPMIRIELDLNREPIPVLADPTQVEMAVLNLAINARDAMPEGGTVSIRTTVRTIADDVELADGDYVEIAVADTGIGMDEATLRRAMEPFFTTKPVGKGTGLGLAQIYGSARQAGGTVRIESIPGRGTTVRFLLPRTHLLPDDPVTLTGDAQKAPQKALHILLVDDDEDVRSIISSALRTQGYRISEAEDGPSALADIDVQRPDIAVIDFAMPEMNGAELARHIRERWPNFPVIFASGFADVEAIRSAVGPGARMLRKPFRIDELLGAVHDCFPNCASLTET